MYRQLQLYRLMMENLSEVKSIKIESSGSNSVDLMERLNEKQVETFKEENEYSIEFERDIKTEPQEDESEFSFPEVNYFTKGCNDDIKGEIDNAMIKIENEDMKNDVREDPLNISNVIKVERITGKYSPSELHIEENNETKPKQEEEYILVIKGEQTDGSRSSSENQLIVKNKPVQNIQKYICEVCNKSFTLKGNLNVHLRIHKQEKPFICTVCKTSFAQKCTLNRHMLIHSSEKPYTCDICKKKFNEKSQFSRHKLSHKGVKYPCDECNKSYFYKHTLVEHKRIHNGDSFTCYICEKIFTTKSNLMQHKRIHTEEKYPCDICDRAFSRKNNLTNHKRCHTKEKPYSCSVCNKTFQQKISFNKHKQKYKH